MDLFPAVNEERWELIKSVIEDCDYYIVIIGGKYGSKGPAGISHTEMEYRYAEEIGLPTIAFLFFDVEKIPSGNIESETQVLEKLVKFREYVGNKTCKYWKSPDELGGKVSRSITQLIKKSPAIGWIRADRLPDKDIFAENANLRKKNEELEYEISLLKNSAPKGTEHLAQGEGKVTLNFIIKVMDSYEERSHPETRVITWNQIMRIVLPIIYPQCIEYSIYGSIIENLDFSKWKSSITTVSFNVVTILMDYRSRGIVKTQLRALGIIVPSIKPRGQKSVGNYWKLTPHGENLMIKLCAMYKPRNQ